MAHVHLRDRIDYLETEINKIQEAVLEAELDMDHAQRAGASMDSMVRSIRGNIKTALHHLNVVQDILEGDEEAFTRP